MKTTNFKKGLVMLILLTVVWITGCNKHDSLTGPNQNFKVSFQISQQEQNGATEFLFKPSADAKISRIVCMYPAQQFTDTLNFTNTNYVYSKDTTYIINEYINVQAGQQWNFDFSGTSNTGNSNYNVTSNYTVQ